MKLSLIIIILIGIFVLNFYSLKIGKLGESNLHRFARLTGASGIVFLLLFSVVLLDTFSQIWVKSEYFSFSPFIVTSVALGVASFFSVLTAFMIKR